jgi:hypothetical protein
LSPETISSIGSEMGNGKIRVAGLENVSPMALVMCVA